MPRPATVTDERRFDFCGVYLFIFLSTRQVSTDYQLPFQTDVQSARLCDVTLKPSDIRELSDAIKEGYYYEFFIDDLPVKG